MREKIRELLMVYVKEARKLVNNNFDNRAYVDDGARAAYIRVIKDLEDLVDAS